MQIKKEKKMKELLKQPKKISDKEIDKIILDEVEFNHRLYEINYKIYKKIIKKIENQECSTTKT